MTLQTGGMNHLVSLWVPYEENTNVIHNQDSRGPEEVAQFYKWMHFRIKTVYLTTPLLCGRTLGVNKCHPMCYAQRQISLKLLNLGSRNKKT